jgi:hypothetical protein
VVQVGASLLAEARSDGGPPEEPIKKKRSCCRWLLPTSVVHPRREAREDVRSYSSTFDMHVYISHDMYI